MNTKTQLVELIRGIEAVVTNEGTMKIIKAKEDLDERIRQVDGMGRLAGLSGDELRWGRDVMDKAKEIVTLFTPIPRLCVCLGSRFCPRMRLPYSSLDTVSLSLTSARGYTGGHGHAVPNVVKTVSTERDGMQGTCLSTTDAYPYQRE